MNKKLTPQIIQADENKIINIIIEPDVYSFNSTKIEKIKIILNANIDFRFNSITGRYEFKPKNSFSYMEFTDRHFNSILSNIRENILPSLAESDLRMVIESDFTPAYNQITDYFNSLPAWNETIDYIKLLADMVTVIEGQFNNEDKDKDAQYIWKIYLEKWLVSSVATMLQRGINHNCIVLIGAQGIGKTTYLRKLAIAPELAYVGAINPADKDSKILYSEKALILLDELEATTKHEQAQLKSNMTLDAVNVRRPYGRRAERLPRRASFCACANDPYILSDLTGSRRWWCVEISKIDYKAVTPELMQNVYSQALSLLNSGYKYWFDDTEISFLEKNNVKFYQSIPEEEALFQIIKHPDEIDSGYDNPCIKTNTELISKMSERIQGIKFSSKKLGQVLSKHKFVRKCRTDDHLQGYEVVIKHREY